MQTTADSLCCTAEDTILYSCYTPVKSKEKRRRKEGREGKREGGEEGRGGGRGREKMEGGRKGRTEKVTSLPKDSISPFVKWEYYHPHQACCEDRRYSVKPQYRAGAPKYQRAEGPVQLTPSSC